MLSMPFIFISYSHKDSEYANRLADRLAAKALHQWTAARIDLCSLPAPPTRPRPRPCARRPPIRPPSPPRRPLPHWPPRPPFASSYCV